MKLAQMEAKLVLASLVYNYAFELSRSEQRMPNNLNIRAGLTLSPAEGVWVNVTKRRKPTAHHV